MDKNILAVALGSMLLGGVAVAAYSNFSDRGDAASFEPVRAGTAPSVDSARLDVPVAAETAIVPAALVPARPSLEYAEVVDVNPVRRSSPRYATVVDTEPLRETSTTSVPREVCQDVVVQQRLPERDGNVGGTVAGALIGGLVGNQVGGGNGRKAATAAGAVAGGFIGNRVDRNHVGGRVVARTERQCHTVNDTARSSRVVGYNVTYRNADGTTGTMHMKSRPGSRIRMGTSSELVGYDVTYRYQGSERTMRMDHRPGARLPVVDGEVLAASAAQVLAERG